MSSNVNRARLRLAQVVRAVIEPLEDRTLLYGDYTTVQPLPFALDFSSAKGGIADRVGLGTGFTNVQNNRLKNEYQPSLIALDTAQGLLNLTDSAGSGSNFGSDNTQVNALGTQFDATKGAFTITTRLKGPLTQIVQPYEQAGILFGPDQDNFVKLVAVAGTNGPALQFVDEQTVTGTITHTLASNAFINIGSFAYINTLDLRLSAVPAAGTVGGSYSVNGGSFVALPSVTLNASVRGSFFSTTGRGNIFVAQKNAAAPITISFDNFQIQPASVTPPPPPTGGATPSVLDVAPASGATNVRIDSYIAFDVKLPNLSAGVDPATLNASTVRFYRTIDGQPVPSYRNTSGGGDDIVIQPYGLLDPNTQYTVQVTSGVADTSGSHFQPYSATFTTGTTGGALDPNIAFEQVNLPSARGQQFTCVTMGPDGKLYASTYDGKIFRWGVNADGTLGAAQVITTVQQNNGGSRTITGITFDPAATASNLILWVSHSQDANQNGQDWTGKVSRLSGANLENYRDVLIHLPRSVKDHMTDQLTFGPDGALYVSQGSDTSYGAPDLIWGMRPEHLLNGAILRVDVSKIPGTLDVQTEGGANYNPYAAGAPVTLYATGVRNAYDLVWASNGQLYAPVNGSSAGGNAPAGHGAPGLSQMSYTEEDVLDRIVPGKYYGHPNPSRGQYVLNNGNSGTGSPYDVPLYPMGTKPEANYQQPVWDFGKHTSADGIIQYQGNAFGGRLNNKLLVARYSGGGGIAAVTLNPDGSVASVETGITGFTGFTNPLDLTEDKRSGFIYVVEYGGQKITLLRPITGGARIAVDKTTAGFNAGAGTMGEAGYITITNVGNAPLALPGNALSITGPSAANFLIRSRPNLPATIAPGQSVQIGLALNAPSVSVGTILTATLTIVSNDTAHPIGVNLRGLVTHGLYGANEPGLQTILNFYGIPIRTGDLTPNDTFYDPTGPSEEVLAQRFVKAGAGRVTVQPLGVFGIGQPNVIDFGYYAPGDPDATTNVFSVPGTSDQTLSPQIVGSTSFDPGSAAFGLYAGFPHFADSNLIGGTPHERFAYSEDALNIWDNGNHRKMRAFPLKNADGSVVPNAYVVVFEDYNLQYDSNDLILIVRNVKPGPNGPMSGVFNLDGFPYSDRLIFNRINIPDPTNKNYVHDTASVRVYNTGTAPLNVSSLGVVGPWQVTSGTGAFTLAPGAFHDVTLKFVATTDPPHTGNQTNGPDPTKGGVWTGSLTINSNDALNPHRAVALVGWWQEQSEHYEEPNLQTMFTSIFGLSTQAQYPAQAFGPQVAAIGDEVLSPYWVAADPQQQVSVRMVASFHSSAPGGTGLAYYARGTTALHYLPRQLGSDFQTFFPRNGGGGPATAQFWAGTAPFGWWLDGQYSDNTKNPQKFPGGNYGHTVRFYPVKDRTGRAIAGEYLAVVDYDDAARHFQYQNFDFQDLVYLITNVKPA